ncbi:bucentaur or craniofacial development-domain-containing protein [Cyathus striatus]|nr:bucentaur or craniofacial development-domain-containing protein [Cyathus striatus]
MATLAKQDFSDSEEDEDYVPPVQEESESSSDESGPESKRARVTSPQKATDEKEAEKTAREALWANFQASVSNPTPPLQVTSTKKMVKVTRRYLFAGEEVVEEIEVPEGSPEAKKWPLVTPSDEFENTSVNTEPFSATIVPPEVNPVTNTFPSAEPLAPKPPARRPGPRKPKTTLASLPGASKAKKLTTLEKSAMDWKAHVKAQEETGVKDELEANRRGGGYLEKVEFLKRVEERKEDNLESLKGSKRRRG